MEARGPHHLQWHFTRSDALTGRPSFAVVPVPAGLEAFGIDRSGRVVGATTDPVTGTRPIVVARSGVVRLATLGGSSGRARGINGGGDVVGGALTTRDAAHHGFLFTHGRMHDLNDLIDDPRWEILDALAINDRGHVLALATRGDADMRVLLVPLGA